MRVSWDRGARPGAMAADELRRGRWIVLPVGGGH